MNEKVYFWLADKHWSVLQFDAIFLGLCRQAWRKKHVFNVFTISKKKKWDIKHADKDQGFLQFDFSTLGIKVSLEGDTIIDRHDQAFSKYSKY